MKELNDMVEVGDKAPDFALKDQDGNIVKLSDYKGKKILLSFHPLAFTKFCNEQMKQLNEKFDKLTELNTIAIGISVDPVPAKKAWSEQLGLDKLKILSDFWPHGKIAESYGVFRGEDGFSERANFVVDENGIVILKKIYEIRSVPDLEEVLSFLRNK